MGHDLDAGEADRLGTLAQQQQSASPIRSVAVSPVEVGADVSHEAVLLVAREVVSPEASDKAARQGLVQ
eukprot:12621411-Prorocentrum_lima.AAC.1